MPILKNTPPSRISTIHFVGIGGVGMAGIAEVLLGEGYHVTGSDLTQSAVTKRLCTLGATIFNTHDAANIINSDIVVVSSAIENDNVEIVAAKKRLIPILARAEMLAELMRFRYGIAVAGTHGKTTTTSLLATIFSVAGFDPTFVIGGCLNSTGSNARLGAGEHLIAEADESDASFLHLLPTMSIVTNIDADHLSAYKNDFTCLKQAFSDFLHQLPFSGLAVLCIDDDVVRALIPTIARHIVSYGFSLDADIRAVDIKAIATSQTFTVSRGALAFPVRLNMPGKHNVLNALAAIAVALEHEIHPATIARALAQFQGVDRRFTVYDQILLQEKIVTVVDDYGHHPSELKVTIEACAAAFNGRRLIWVFQPHRYSRTRDCFADFCAVLQKADCLILLDVYPAGEAVIKGADGRALFNAIASQASNKVLFAPTLASAYALLATTVQDNDVVLLQGAGTIKQLVHRVCLEDAIL